MRTLRAVVVENATRRPDALAFVALDRAALSHADLLALVDRTTASLRAAGLGSTSRVLLSLPHGPNAVVATFVLATAVAAAPRNSQLTAAEIANTVEGLRPDAVVVDAAARSAARDIAVARGIPLIELRDAGDEWFEFVLPSVAPDRDIHDHPAAESWALILETSGTSGRAKQVPLTHTNVIAGATAMNTALALTEDDCCIHVMPPFAIAGIVHTVIAPLVAGGTTIVAGPYDPQSFLAAAEAGATWWNAGPTMQRSIAKAVRDEPKRWERVRPRLRFTRCASAPLAAPSQVDLEAVLGLPIVHAYGMTEAGPAIATNGLDEVERRLGSSGRPSGTSVRVVDAAGEPVEPGTTGHIEIAGPAVCAGYLDDAASKAAFADGWFRTGDIGSFDDDGFLYVLGREMDIINRGGVLLSPAEIDAVALRHPEVEDAAAFAIPHPSLGHEVGLAVVTAAAKVPHDLRAHLGANLAPQKLPRVVTAVTAIPRTATNKPLRAELTAAVIHRPADAEPPKGQLERAIAALWKDAIGIAPPGRHEDFFLSGGDSLGAITLMAAVEDRFGIVVDLGAFLDDPTVAGIAAGLSDRNASARPGVQRVRSGIDDIPAAVIVSGIGGGAVTAAALAAKIIDGRAVYAVEAPGLRTGRHPRRVEQLAADHVAALAEAIGPRSHVLVGYSFGCLVAWEMASQLEAAGHTVALVLVDGWTPRGQRAHSPLRSAARWARAAGWPGARGSRVARRQVRIRRAREIARERYRGPATPFGGPVALIATSKRQEEAGEDLGWSALLGRPVPTTTVPGRHRNFVRLPVALSAVARVVAETGAALER